MGMGLLCLYIDFTTYMYCKRVARDDMLLKQVVEEILVGLNNQKLASLHVN